MLNDEKIWEGKSLSADRQGVKPIMEKGGKIPAVKTEQGIFPILGSGVDLRYIQEILGHKSSKTTEIYTYVSTKNLSAIKNPLDSILTGGEI